MKTLILVAGAMLAIPAAAQSASDYHAADAQLNATYRSVMTRMQQLDRGTKPSDLPPAERAGPTYAQALLNSQRAWLAYRDANCRAFSYEYRGGSAQGLSDRVCLTRVTRARTAELRLLQSVFAPK
ncbi:lysozyme inhibitor LprI family protein [Sphingomonas sp. Mn802worker]|uniref:lysozyme inhibitor LprI family protein n=2 Tax=Sphingomonas TaxID=13687 RepID=UPI00035C7B36|nr:lysozyme inhibitor LprI family protein [Sphingomonas sp. Mn802worker]